VLAKCCNLSSEILMGNIQDFAKLTLTSGFREGM
jgi:hypothetical protein